MNSKLMLWIVVLVVLAGGIWYMRGAGTPPPATAPVTERPAVNQASTIAQEPAPTGKADDILASIDGEQSQEAAATMAGDADAETVLSDGGAINGLSQTYDETKL